MSKLTPYHRAYGQFFTPAPVVACCYALLAGGLPPNPHIADPACGDGAFLRYAAAHQLAAPARIAGCDLDAALVAGLAAEGLTGVSCADGLQPESLTPAVFDLVIGNPPFGVATSPNSQQKLASEVRFLLHSLELARPGGYIALVLPSGVLANERLREVRAALLRRATALAVIALPRDTFHTTGTSAACSILLLRNAPAPPDHQVFFALARHTDDLPALVAAYHAKRPQNPADEAEQPPATPAAAYNSGPAEAYWLAQTTALARRLDAPFWRPAARLLLERLAAHHPTRPLGDIIDHPDGLIAGDHVRPSRGEAKGPHLLYEYYQTREFMPAGYNYVAIERCDERAYHRLKHTAVQQHDILVSCAGVGGAGNGRVCLITHQPGPSCTGDVFILRARQLDPIFLFVFLAARGGHQQLLRLQNGVGTANLSADELRQVMLPLVAPEQQRLFAARYAPIATAHERSMAALSHADTAGFQRERAYAAELLNQLKRDIERLTLGD